MRCDCPNCKVHRFNPTPGSVGASPTVMIVSWVIALGIAYAFSVWIGAV